MLFLSSSIVRVSFLVLFLTALPAAAKAAEFLPHQAVYRINLASSKPGSGIIGASGSMFYKFSDACDGWTAETRTVLRFQYDRGRYSDSVWSFVGWEAKDGSRFRYRLNNVRDGKKDKEIRGEAVIKASRGAIARFAEPPGVSMKLPKDILFPTKHLRLLLDAAARGEKFYSRPIFDGASMENPYQVSAILNKVPVAQSKAIALKLGLAEARGWLMRLAFFPLSGGKETPEFEVDVRYREDGVADFIRQDYGDIVLEMTVEDMEVLPKSAC